MKTHKINILPYPIITCRIVTVAVRGLVEMLLGVEFSSHVDCKTPHMVKASYLFSLSESDPF